MLSRERPPHKQSKPRGGDSWYSVYYFYYKSFDIDKLVPVKVFLMHHRLPTEPKRALDECLESVKTVCRSVRDLVDLRRQMDGARLRTMPLERKKHSDERVSLVDDTMAMSDLSFDVHAVTRRIETAVLGAYDAHGFAWMSIAKSISYPGKRDLKAVKYAQQKDFSALMDLLENERLRAAYMVFSMRRNLVSYLPVQASRSKPTSYVDRLRESILERERGLHMRLHE